MSDIKMKLKNKETGVVWIIDNLERANEMLLSGNYEKVENKVVEEHTKSKTNRTTKK